MNLKLRRSEILKKVKKYVDEIGQSVQKCNHMKRLSSLRLLKGQSETITVSDLRAAPGDVLAQVQQGKTFSITKQGKVVASLAPMKDKNENN